MSEAAAICLRRASLPTVPQRESGPAKQISTPESDPLEAFDGELELPLEEPKLTWAVDLGHELLALSTVDLWYALNTGTIRPDVKVWCVGREAWAKASDVPELACALRFSRPWMEGEPPRSTLDYAVRPPSFGLRKPGGTPGSFTVSPYDDTPLPLGVLPAPPGMSPAPAAVSPSPLPCAPPPLPEQPVPRAAPDALETWLDMPPLPCSLDAGQVNESDVEGPLEEQAHSVHPVRSLRAEKLRRRRGPKSWILAASLAACATVAAGISLAATASTPHVEPSPMLVVAEENARLLPTFASVAVEEALVPAGELATAAAPPPPSAKEEPAPREQPPVADLPILAPKPTPATSARATGAPSKARKKTWSPSRRGQERRRQSSR